MYDESDLQHSSFVALVHSISLSVSSPYCFQFFYVDILVGKKEKKMKKKNKNKIKNKQETLV